MGTIGIPQVEAQADLMQEVEFTFTTLTFHLTALQQITLPEYKGSAFRGGFGHAFRKVCCVEKPGQPCETCLLNTSCAYAYAFETPQTEAYGAHIQSTNLPHPFVILPPLTSREVIETGESMSFQLTLIGRGIDFLPYFVYAFDELGRRGIGRGRGRYRLEYITADNGATVYNAAAKRLTDGFHITHFRDLAQKGQADAREIELDFITPTRILNRNKLVDHLPFDLLIRNLLRRGSLLAKVHCRQEWKLDFGAIIQLARDTVQTVASKLEWKDWERYSTRQQQRMKLGGFVGRVKFRGEFAPFMPLIRLGEHIHVAKNTSFGMGKYVVKA